MDIQGINRSDPEKVFVSCRNVTGATVSAGVPVEMEVATITDGNSVTACRSNGLCSLFVGVTDASMADDAYGLVQVYGFRTSAWHTVTAKSAQVTPGQFLIAGSTGGAATSFVDATRSAATTSGWNQVCLAETLSASGLQEASIFIKNM